MKPPTYYLGDGWVKRAVPEWIIIIAITDQPSLLVENCGK